MLSLARSTLSITVARSLELVEGPQTGVKGLTGNFLGVLSLIY